MEFFLEMLLTAVVAVLFSFLVAKLVSASMAGNSGGGVNDQAEEIEIGVGDGFVAVEEELRFGLKMDATVVQSERRLGVVDENVERFVREADRVVDEAAKGEDFVVPSDEFLASVSPENVIAEEMIVPGEDEQRVSVSEEGEEFIVRTADEAESTSSASPENMIAEEFIIRTAEEEAESTSSVSLKNMIAEEIMILGQEVRSAEDVTSGEVDVTESVEVSVEESNTVEESERNMELNTQGENEEKEELSIEEEEDDDWEGIERSELEKTFATTSNLLVESGKAEEIGDEAKMELYGLYKIATEGSCRETQPMAIMVSARAKWNAWQKFGNMSQEEAMEKYLALVSNEIPGLLNTLGKMPETDTSVVLPPNSGSLEDPSTLGTTGVAFSKNGKPEER